MTITPQIPLVVGMNPSQHAPNQSWAPTARSTQLIADFVFGDPDRVDELVEGLELDNLNPTIPDGCERRMRVDPAAARITLGAWHAGGRLRHRTIVLLGDEVAKCFFDWLEVKHPGHAEPFDTGLLPKGPGLRIVMLPHPGRILRLRRRSAAKWREALGHAETRFHSIAAAFAEGEAILFAEARRIDSELIEEDARVARLLAIDEQNQLLEEEEEEIARALYDEALREFRRDNEHDEQLDRLDDHVNGGWWHGDD